MVRGVAQRGFSLTLAPRHPEIAAPMPIALERSRGRVPPRALILSCAALLVPMAGAFLLPQGLADYGTLLWLLALVPAFLLAYYRGWQGAATALAAGMASLSLTAAVAVWLGRAVPDLLLGVVVGYVAIALGIGWLAERLHRDRDEVEDMAFTDILTHLPNRRHARVFPENEFAAGERGRLLSVVLFDLDGFKEFNDRHGHQAGDDAPGAFADILTRTTRRMNLSARFGGEEFLSVLAGSDAEGAMVFADRVRMALVARDLGEMGLTVSAGVATHHPTMRSPDELLAAADYALYQAKREGRNCVRLFGHAALEQVQPGPGPAAASGTPVLEDPRAAEELGKGRPPASLMPQQVSAFGSGRRVLLVEDEAQVRNLIANYLSREGFSVTEVGNVIDRVWVLGEEFDIVVTDIRLPGAGGTELVAAVKSRWPASQVIVITGLQDAQVAADALNAGADRYLFKPFGMPELRAHLVDALAHRDRILAERTEKNLLSDEARDPYTAGHAVRVGRYAHVLAFGVPGTEQLFTPDSLRLACELHDVGKIGVPDSVLNKGGPLTSEELHQVRKHPRTGRRILEPLLDDEAVLEAVTWHHERWDGRGYPDGLAGAAVPTAARIVGAADALDAMTSPRAYRPALSWEAALQEMRDRAGAQFDPEVVSAVERSEEELRAIFEERARSRA